MDFEELLHRTEGLPAPSLTGASVRLADDSPHNNYIHPEKYASLRGPVRSDKFDYKSKLSSSVTASLDDLINEGALMGSEEDFDRYLDSEGHVRDNAIYEEDKEPKPALSPEIKDKKWVPALTTKESEKLPLSHNILTGDDVDEKEIVVDTNSGMPSALQLAADASVSLAGGFGEPKAPLYSTPNLSEYQLSHSLSSQLDLVNSLQLHDYHELPTSDAHHAVAASKLVQGTPRGIRGNNALLDRSPSRTLSRSAVPGRRPAHLARGDNYKSTHPEDPQNYELPARLDNLKLSPPSKEAHALRDDADEDSGRQSRKSRPTMGDKVARAEAGHIPEPITQLPMSREPSLLTSGDYCNFNADTPSHDFKADERIYSTRSASSTNYLRSISRSRSRARPMDTEKNDANCTELAEDGALVSEDPFETIANLDIMVNQVLHPVKDKRSHSSLAKEISTDEVVGDAAKDNEKRNQENHHPTTLPDLALNSIRTERAAATPEEVVPEVKRDSFEISISEMEPEVSEGSALVESAPILEGENPSQECDVAKSGEADTHSETSKIQVEPETPDELERAEYSQVVKDIEAFSHSNVDEKGTFTSKTTGSPDTSKLHPSNTECEASLNDVGSDSISALLKSDSIGVRESSVDVENLSTVDDEDTSKSVISETIAKPESIQHVSLKASQPAENVETVDSKDISTEHSEEEYDVSPEELRKHLMAEPVYIYTSLAGGMRITQKTNRLTTILRANEVKFTYRDLGTDPAAKRTWQRQANGRPLPGVVRGDDLIGNYDEIDEANEEGRIDTLLYETI